MDKDPSHMHSFEPRERICKTCAWGKRDLDRFNELYIKCCLEPKTEQKEPDDFCRYHALTTGWLEEENRPLIQWAPGMPPEHYSFETTSPDEKELRSLIEEVWQKYLTLCQDWQLMKKGENR